MINLPDFVFSLVMGCLMSLSITFVTTLARLGVTDGFFGVWLEVWLVAYPVAVICILIYKPWAGKLTAKLLEKMK
ncbi:DUF2798 domain-containing protein [Polynucleobacter sp. AP-Latsch-80-C2]|jgi:hypothetical protein|uniref:DUF2798 domain-containing protein n=1 Tax=Polynucleobacter sp. AP-Latsch-80-C2 TaxID=2576931 RepID=UPI001C0B2958|nr:DUF2798 domain-containing protein [Polynucleobacter sp. AP-Latsch-80-C2]MBU3622736.1 DUF2798 domain-containing protein [Polynucleobacter sp. AP-Latsch-80-C2]